MSDLQRASRRDLRSGSELTEMGSGTAAEYHETEYPPDDPSRPRESTIQLGVPFESLAFSEQVAPPSKKKANDV